ncbi:MAG: metallophosphoesterase family protein [Rhodospirillales bacterium]
MNPRHQTTGEGPAAAGSRSEARAPEGSRVYAVGDIHGRADLLARLHRQIIEDAGDDAGLRRVVVYLGDYVDRGPQSFEVVEMLIREPLPGFERHHLKGNHEDFLVRFLETGEMGQIWMINGGNRTLASYGVDVWDMLSDFGALETARCKFRDALPESHRRFFAGLKLHHGEGDYLFVHAGLRPGRTLEEQSAHDMMWIREEFLNSDADFGQVVVHGHSISWEPEVRPNRIGIDTGAYRSSTLTALVLEGDERRFLET